MCNFNRLGKVLHTFQLLWVRLVNMYILTVIFGATHRHAMCGCLSTGEKIDFVLVTHLPRDAKFLYDRNRLEEMDVDDIDDIYGLSQKELIMARQRLRHCGALVWTCAYVCACACVCFVCTWCMYMWLWLYMYVGVCWCVWVCGACIEWMWTCINVCVCVRACCGNVFYVGRVLKQKVIPCTISSCRACFHAHASHTCNPLRDNAVGVDAMREPYMSSQRTVPVTEDIARYTFVVFCSVVTSQVQLRKSSGC